MCKDYVFHAENLTCATVFSLVDINDIFNTRFSIFLLCALVTENSTFKAFINAEFNYVYYKSSQATTKTTSIHVKHRCLPILFFKNFHSIVTISIWIHSTWLTTSSKIVWHSYLRKAKHCRLLPLRLPPLSVFKITKHKIGSFDSVADIAHANLKWIYMHWHLQNDRCWKIRLRAGWKTEVVFLSWKGSKTNSFERLYLVLLSFLITELRI